MSRSPTKAVEADAAREYLAGFRAVDRLILEGSSLSGRERNCVFLNTGSRRFGNVSAISGLDFPDDGRAIATLDWDHDGDLDVWQVNRSAPQIRFLRNDTPTDAHFLRVRLIGRTSNRDGIGARLELYLEDQPDRKIIKTLRAGEGYLSQSSKWVHFGLGQSTRIDRLVVQWPGNQAETFTGLKANQRYYLRQGAERVEVWTPPKRKVALASKKLERPPETGRARAWLGVRAPVGSLAYRDLDNVERSLDDFRGKPVLVNLWATWCPPCIKELGEFGRREQNLREGGLEILALNVDGLGDGRSSDRKQARELLARLNFHFASGRATRALLTNLEVLRNGLFKWGRPFAVPTSFLIDAEGWLAGIYTGPVEVERLLADLIFLEAEPEQLRAYAAPFEGRWIEPPREITTARSLAKRATDHYDSAVDLAKADRLEDAVKQYRQVLAFNPDHAHAHNNLGAIFAGQGRVREAMAEYHEALRIDAEDSRAHKNLGVALLGQPGQLDEAVTHFKRSLAIDPEQATVEEGLGTALARQGKVEEATKHFRQAVRIEPEQASAHFNLGAALFNQGNIEEAVKHYRKALELKPDFLDAHLSIADILEHQGKVDEAIYHCRQALRIHPDHPAVLHTLTLAYAAAGRFQEAVETAKRLLSLAEASGQSQLVADLKRRLELYRTKIRSLNN